LPYNFLLVELGREFFKALLPLAAVHLHSLGALCVGRSRIFLRAITFYPLDFGVRAAGLFHLLHTWMRPQFSLGGSLQVAVKSLVVSVQLGD
jgi:hypothetical protein